YVFSSPTVSNGIVYIGNFNGDLYAIDANTGIKKWQYNARARIDGSPIESNGIIYFGTAGLRRGDLYALDALTGALKWNYVHTNTFRSSPVVFDGVVYISSHSCILAVDATNGTLKWNYFTLGFEDIFASSCIVDTLSNVYVSSVSGSHN